MLKYTKELLRSRRPRSLRASRRREIKTELAIDPSIRPRSLPVYTAQNHVTDLTAKRYDEEKTMRYRCALLSMQFPSYFGGLKTQLKCHPKENPIQKNFIESYLQNLAANLEPFAKESNSESNKLVIEKYRVVFLKII